MSPRSMLKQPDSPRSKKDFEAIAGSCTLARRSRVGMASRRSIVWIAQDHSRKLERGFEQAFDRKMARSFGRRFYRLRGPQCDFAPCVLPPLKAASKPMTGSPPLPLKRCKALVDGPIPFYRNHTKSFPSSPNFSAAACMERPTKWSCFAASRSNVRQRIHFGFSPPPVQNAGFPI
jgi:hypothetical protein